ncbi:hypothetical protein C8Q78DRAFT_1083630 [Trametes maxima]|nr:hypothetical protein C8Q78DRAFT_1083630 [Trametes maxima]
MGDADSLSSANQGSNTKEITSAKPARGCVSRGQRTKASGRTASSSREGVEQSWRVTNGEGVSEEDRRGNQTGTVEEGVLEMGPLKGRRRAANKKSVKKEADAASFAPKVKSTSTNEAWVQKRNIELAELADKARLGYAFGPLVADGVVTPLFGKWNNRDVLKSKVRALEHGFTERGIQNWTNVIAVVVPRNFVDVDSLNLQRNMRDREKMLKSAMVDAEKAHVAQEYEDAIRAVRTSLEVPAMWQIAVFDESLVTEELGRYLSRNEVHATYNAGAEEKLYWNFMDIEAVVQEKNGLYPGGLCVGSKEWLNDVVKPVIGDVAHKQGVGSLFCFTHSFAFLRSIYRLSYFANGSTIKAEKMRARLRPLSTSTKSIVDVRADNTVCSMWATLIQGLCDDMCFVATSQTWPAEGNVSTSEGATLAQCLGALQTGVEAEMSDAAVSARQDLGRLVNDAMAAGFDAQEWIWHPDLMKRIDALYDMHLSSEVMLHFGNSASAVWRDAMDAYWEDVVRTCLEWWAREPHGGHTSNTIVAQEHAPAKLIWLRKLREVGERFDLPLPTSNAIEGMYNALQGLSIGLQWICRQIDPLVDRNIYTSSGSVWDHTSNAVAFLTNAELCIKRSDQPAAFYRWIFTNILSIRAVDVQLREKWHTKDITQLYCKTPGAWRTAAAEMDGDPTVVPKQFSAVWKPHIWDDTDSATTIELRDVLVKYVPKYDSDSAKQHTRGERPKSRSVPAGLPIAHIRRYPCLRMLSQNAVEWRNVDAHNRPAQFHGLVFQVFTLYQMYSRSMHAAMQQSTARALRDSLLVFVSSYRKPTVDRYSSHVRAQGAQQAVMPPAHVNWDEALVKSVVASLPDPEAPFSQEAQLREQIEAAERWDKYTTDLHKIFAAVQKSNIARFAHDDPNTMEGNVQQALDQFILALTINANRLEYRCGAGRGGEPFVEPQDDSLRLVPYPSCDSAFDANSYVDLSDFKHREPDMYQAFIVRRREYVTKLERSKAEDLNASEMHGPTDVDKILPQHLAGREEEEVKSARSAGASSVVASGGHPGEAAVIGARPSAISTRISNLVESTRKSDGVLGRTSSAATAINVTQHASTPTGAAASSDGGELRKDREMDTTGGAGVVRKGQGGECGFNMASMQIPSLELDGAGKSQSAPSDGKGLDAVGGTSSFGGAEINDVDAEGEPDSEDERAVTQHDAPTPTLEIDVAENSGQTHSKLPGQRTNTGLGAQPQQPARGLGAEAQPSTKAYASFFVPATQSPGGIAPKDKGKCDEDGGRGEQREAVDWEVLAPETPTTSQPELEPEVEEDLDLTMDSDVPMAVSVAATSAGERGLHDSSQEIYTAPPPDVPPDLHDAFARVLADRRAQAKVTNTGHTSMEIARALVGEIASDPYSFRRKAAALCPLDSQPGGTSSAVEQAVEPSTQGTRSSEAASSPCPSPRE